MTRKIKAQDVKPGMEIEWTYGGWKHSGTIARGQMANSASLFVAIGTADGVWQTLELDQEVTVLAEPQPVEPTAFGAAVEVDGVKHVRVKPKHVKDHPDYCPWISEYGVPVQWDYICAGGPVEVKPYSFATPAQDELKPHVFEVWEDVPEMVAVEADRALHGRLCRKNGLLVEIQDSDGTWRPSLYVHAEMNESAPFTGVRDA